MTRISGSGSPPSTESSLVTCRGDMPIGEILHAHSSNAFRRLACSSRTPFNGSGGGSEELGRSGNHVARLDLAT